jgi:hypothetical protein
VSGADDKRAGPLEFCCLGSLSLGFDRGGVQFLRVLPGVLADWLVFPAMIGLWVVSVSECLKQRAVFALV